MVDKIFGGQRTPDMQCSQVSQLNHAPTIHGGRRCPAAAMAPHSRCCHIRQSARTMHDKAVSLKLNNIIIITLNFTFQSRCIVVCVCLCQQNEPTSTKHTTITILNALSLACAKSSICSTQISFVMALGGVLVKELFNNVGYWWRTRVPRLVNPLRAQKRAIAKKHIMQFTSIISMGCC